MIKLGISIENPQYLNAQCGPSEKDALYESESCYMIREQNLLSIHNSQISGFKVSQAVVLSGTTQTRKSLATSNNSIESV